VAVIAPLSSADVGSGSDYDSFKLGLLQSLSIENNKRKELRMKLIFKKKSVLVTVFVLALLIMLLIGFVAISI
ncbi:MAG: hypothetical protein KDC84_16125, partial [Crocinitomicaceae bacterium]|nr:hypothetical protein [Crocinitomicaceae bacterium]